MNRRWLHRCLAVLATVLALAACGGRAQKASPGVSTQTVAPAAARPSPTGTDAATQTVNVDDGRSEDEGADATATTAAPRGTAPASHAESSKKRR